jgi:hypothetical protein
LAVFSSGLGRDFSWQNKSNNERPNSNAGKIDLALLIRLFFYTKCKIASSVPKALQAACITAPIENPLIYPYNPGYGGNHLFF